MSEILCYLTSKDKRHDDILIGHKMPITIGRGPLTLIKDKRCSRNQIELIADVEKKTLQLRQLGANPCCVNGCSLPQHQTTALSENQVFHLLEDEYPYVVHFSSGNNCINDRSPAKRHLAETEIKSCKKKKREMSPKCDLDDEEEEERVQQIKNQLAKFRENQGTSEFQTSAVGTSSASVNDGRFENRENKWQMPSQSLLIFMSKGLKSSSKIAAFDMDGTIITTRSGRVFPKDTSDWKIQYPEVRKKLCQLHQDNFKVVLFTNQKALSKWKAPVEQFKEKIEKIVSELNIPIQVFISTGNGIYRKPACGMWTYLVENANDNISVDMEVSFYVGDAAGRDVKWALGKKKDFSIADRLFAWNVGLTFFTPEEYFLKWDKAAFKKPAFDPRDLMGVSLLYEPATESLTSSSQEMIIFVGYPASGKSFFAECHLLNKGYIIISRDKLGTWQKCVSMCKHELNRGKSVVVDNTNPDKQSRERFINCCRVNGIPCRCFLFDITLDHARHNNRFRLLTMKDKPHENVNEITLNSYKSKFEEPSLREGFTSILKIKFVPTFQDKEIEKLYHMFLV